MPKACAAFNCTARYGKEPGITFHKFPLNDKELLAKWVQAVRRDRWTPTRSSYLCSKHFAKDCFRIINGYTCLHSGTVPSIFDLPAHLQKKTGITRTSKKRTAAVDFGLTYTDEKENVNITHNEVETKVTANEIAAAADHDHGAYQLPSPRKLVKRLQQQETLCQQVTETSRQRCQRQQVKILRLEETFVNRDAIRCIFWRSLHTLPINLAIKRSSLPGASYGIWSKEYIPVGTRFGPYSDITNEDLGEEGKIDCHSKIDRKKSELDTLESQEERQPNWLGYINCTRNEMQQNLLGFHFQSDQGEVELYYLNYKPIPANTELLIWHSKTYTKTLGIEPKDYTYCESELNSVYYSGYSDKTKRPKRIDDDLRNSVFCLEISNSGIKKPDIIYNDLHENVFVKGHLLDYEEQSYSKSNPFICYICYHSFSNTKDLQVHIRAHAGGSTYECDVCHKVFARIYSLHSHKMTHYVNIEKPYECNVCGKRYSQRHFLKRHTRMHLIEEARLQYVS